MPSEEMAAAGLAAMNLFGMLLLGWIVVIAAAIHLTHPDDADSVAYSTPPFAVLGTLGFGALVTAFYAAERVFVQAVDSIPATISSFEQVVFGFLAVTALVFILLVTKPLADSIRPIFDGRMGDPKQAAYAAFGIAFLFELAVTAGTIQGILSAYPALG